MVKVTVSHKTIAIFRRKVSIHKVDIDLSVSSVEEIELSFFLFHELYLVFSQLCDCCGPGTALSLFFLFIRCIV